MRLREFSEMVERLVPEEISAAVVRDVDPPPMITRHGPAGATWLRMEVAGRKYERRAGGEPPMHWRRVDEWTPVAEPEPSEHVWPSPRTVIEMAQGEAKSGTPCPLHGNQGGEGG